MKLIDKIFKVKKAPKRNKDTGTALERYWKSFKHALSGISYCLKHEHNMIIILIATVFAVAWGIAFEIDSYEWLFIIFICGAIAACECVNSAIEAAVDLITTDIHPLAKIAKDTASSATLLLCITALIGGLIIFIPKLGGLL